jgi:hypothetical protein
LTYYVSIKTADSVYESFEVPREVYEYVLQLEACIKYPAMSRLKEFYPGRFDVCDVHDSNQPLDTMWKPQYMEEPAKKEWEKTDMAREILAVPEQHLDEVIRLIRLGLCHSLDYPGHFSQEVREHLMRWCDEEEEYLKGLREGELAVSTIERPSFVTDEHLEYLDDLRGSGEANMFGASPYLQAVFGLDKKRAGDVLLYWMKTFRERMVEE